MRDYRSYYTPLKLASYLLESININDKDKILDLCCGSSNLLKAANIKNPNAYLTGVDLNLNHVDYSLDANYICMDGRDYAIKSFENNTKYNIVLANPPFELDASYSKYDDLIACNVDFSNVTRRNLLSEMIMANILSVEDNGHLVLIIPSSVVLGDNFNKIRMLLASHFIITGINELPNTVFNNKEVYTYAITMTKDSSLRSSIVPVKKVINKSNSFGSKLIQQLSEREIKEGSWVRDIASDTMGILNAKVFRGKISTNEFSDEGTPVLHVSKKIDKCSWEPKVMYYNGNEIKADSIVKENDVIVSRIGRDAGEIYCYKGEDMYVSDCLIVLRGIDFYDLKNHLNSIYGTKHFGFLKKGTASKYVSQRDIERIVC